MESKNEFTRAWFNEFREMVSKALSELGDEIGFDIQPEDIRYEPGVSFDLKVKFTKRATENFDPQKENWIRYCSLYNLTSEMYGQTVILRGEQYRIVGLNTEARKNIVKMQRIRDNERFSTTPDVIRQVLSGQDNKSEAEKNWSVHAWMLGLKGVPFGAEFVVKGKRYQISGVNPNAREYKILGREKTGGKEFKFRPEDVKSGLIKAKDEKDGD